MCTINVKSQPNQTVIKLHKPQHNTDTIAAISYFRAPYHSFPFFYEPIQNPRTGT